MSTDPVDPATFFTGSYDGRICAYNMAEGECVPIHGTGPTTAVVAVDTSEDGKAYLAGMDNTIREISSTAGQFAFGCVSMQSQYESGALTLADLQVGDRTYRGIT